MYKGLLSRRYITEKKGFKFGRKIKQTRTSASPKLKMRFKHYKVDIFDIRDEHSETIILRDSSKKRTDYKDISKTNDWRHNLQQINEVLNATWIDLYIPDAELKSLNKKLLKSEDDDKRAIDFSVNRLRRVFNNGKWDEGGRFYNGWWQNIPKEYRRDIRIVDKRTIEIDFKCMHPAMLYAKCTGTVYTEDAYEISGVDRDLSKKIFNILLNSKSENTAISAVASELQNIGKGHDKKLAAEITTKMHDKHPKIKHLFMTSYGVKLQFLDSQIAEYIMLNYSEHRSPILPVHDSFIMHHGYREELPNVLSDAFNKFLRVDISTSIIEGAFQPESKEPSDDGHTTNEREDMITDIQKEREEFSQYYKRGERYNYSY